ncbi:MAG: hypothetical protein QW450_03390 [Candidatus Nitrosocaldus sp.]|jgi:uncharacterized pyridoxamine 5'-phosphate oxidase family protein|uniref:Uncharacterized protein n=1 Tax=Candidatus Nitrosocaldus cavascurensis TaxID=2058097 RepID=A0A2K5AQP4_9ARCH|nr:MULTISPECIES: hypothetical protein [Candidatus Nitrosocaldus]GBC74111.1 hypothetical protein HRbin05_00144 [archaeon HR05]SPC33934.1 conserved protein of unknown function [Candidatus Nitrosocaldus cavascurensis]
MGKVGKGVRCSVVECSNNAVRSLDAGKVRGSGLDVSEGKRVYLCEEHYKQWKKVFKQSKSDDISIRYK